MASPPSSPLSSPTSLTHDLPTQTYHTTLLPRSIPTASLLDTAVGGAHYSGVESVNARRRHSVRSPTHALNVVNENGASLIRRRSSAGAVPEVNAFHLTVLDDLKDVCDPPLLAMPLIFFFS